MITEERLPADRLSFSVRNGGFTLIEVMVAMTILLVGLLAFISIQLTAIRTNDANKKFLLAQDIVSTEIESIKTLGYSGLTTSQNLINGYGYFAALTSLPAQYQLAGIDTTCNAPYTYCVYKGVSRTRSGGASYYYTVKLSYNTNYLLYPILGNGNMMVYWVAATNLKSSNIAFFVGSEAQQ